MMHRPRAPGPASAAAALGRSPGEEDGPAVPPAEEKQPLPVAIIAYRTRRKAGEVKRRWRARDRRGDASRGRSRPG